MNKTQILKDLSENIKSEMEKFRKENNFYSLDEELEKAKDSGELKIVRTKIDKRKELLSTLSTDSYKSLSLKKTGFINIIALIGIISIVSIIGVCLGYLLYRLNIG